MSNKKLKAGLLYLVANLLNKATAFLAIPIFTRLLSTSEYGFVSAYLAYVSVLQYLIGLSSEYTIRNAYIDYPDRIPEYMSSLYSLSVVSAAIMAVILCGVNFFAHVASMLIVVCCVVQAFFLFVNNAICVKLMMDDSYRARSVLLAAPGLLSIILGILFILFLSSDREFGRILGYIISFAIFGSFVLARTWRRKRPSRRYWSYILHISPPMIVHGLSLVALSQIDRIMLASFDSAAAAGVYSLSYSISMAAMALTSAVEGIWVPEFTKLYAEEAYREIARKARNYLALIGGVVSCAVLVSPEVVGLMVPESYWGGIVLMPLLMASCFVISMYSFCIALEIYEKETKAVSLMTIAAALLNIGLNAVFIPGYGMIAAAVTTLVSYLVLFMMHYLNCRRIRPGALPARIFILSSLSVLIVGVVFCVFLESPLVRWSLFFAITLCSGWLYLRSGKRAAKRREEA